MNVEFVGTKVAVVERRAGERALTLAMRRGSEVSDGLRSPEPAIPELEISWVSEEREELEEKGDGKKLEREPGPPCARNALESMEERISKPFYHLLFYL